MKIAHVAPAARSVCDNHISYFGFCVICVATHLFIFHRNSHSFPYASTKYAIKVQIENSILVNSLGVFFSNRRHARDINDKQYQIRTTAAAAAVTVPVAALQNCIYWKIE